MPAYTPACSLTCLLTLFTHLPAHPVLCYVQHHWRQHRARRAALLADQGVREPLSDEDDDAASDTGSHGHGDNGDQGAGSENASQHSRSPRGSSDGSAMEGAEGAGQRVAKAKRCKAPGKGAKGKQPQAAGAAGTKSK